MTRSRPDPPRRWGLPLAAALAALACGEDVLLGRVPGPDAAPGVDGPAACSPSPCAGRVFACGDCVDNDGDGAIDAVDDQCVGPCDDSEDSFHPSLPGENEAQCRVDCFFDGDTGTGNDDCFWSHACDPLSLPPDFAPSADARCAYDPGARIAGTAASCADLGASQSDTCRDTCLRLVPNGCDCFGCCELPAGSGRTVWLGSQRDRAGTCDAASLDDPSRCRPCTQVPSCTNPCEPCEACLGGGGSSAPCAEGGAPPPCPDDVPRCTPGATACPAGSYCVTGCCIGIPR